MAKFVTLQPRKLLIGFRDPQRASVHGGQLAVAVLLVTQLLHCFTNGGVSLSAVDATGTQMARPPTQGVPVCAQLGGVAAGVAGRIATALSCVERGDRPRHGLVMLRRRSTRASATASNRSI